MKKARERIYLSPPFATREDIHAVKRAMKSGWVAPVGPDLVSFESEMSAYLGSKYAVALSSGTAALHLGLRYLGVQPGDSVLLPTLTFAATAFSVVYQGALPVFVDVDESWNLDPDSLRTCLTVLRKDKVTARAVISVDLYGSPCNYEALSNVLEEFEVPLLEDAAEALGGVHQDQKLGTVGKAGALSFNGNKILTSAGGGMLITEDVHFADKVRYWSTQSREDVPWYEHREVGFNYRLSNVLAALGRSQLSRIGSTVEHRRSVRNWYAEELKDVPGVSVRRDPPWGKSNAWLSLITISSDMYPDGPRRVREALEYFNIESRPVWKPLHRQPIFESSKAFITGVADKAFKEGLCLPSGPKLSHSDVRKISTVIKQTLAA